MRGTGSVEGYVGREWRKSAGQSSTAGAQASSLLPNGLAVQKGARAGPSQGTTARVARAIGILIDILIGILFCCTHWRGSLWCLVRHLETAGGKPALAKLRWAPSDRRPRTPSDYLNIPDLPMIARLFCAPTHIRSSWLILSIGSALLIVINIDHWLSPPAGATCQSCPSAIALGRWGSGCRGRSVRLRSAATTGRSPGASAARSPARLCWERWTEAEGGKHGYAKDLTTAWWAPIKRVSLSTVACGLLRQISYVST